VTARSTAPRVPWADPQGVSPVIGSLDVNPADGSLWPATNTGLFRLPEGAQRPQRVAGQLTTELGSGEISQQLVIRFRGPDEMVGSGHPPPDSALPPALGLIESQDAGRSWTGVSDVGYADFHAIQLAGDTLAAAIYGQAAINVSHDGGKTFENRTPPLPLVDLEIDPHDPARWIASTTHGVISSSDEGRSWRAREATPKRSVRVAGQRRAVPHRPAWAREAEHRRRSPVAGPGIHRRRATGTVRRERGSPLRRVHQRHGQGVARRRPNLERPPRFQFGPLIAAEAPGRGTLPSRGEAQRQARAPARA
jgi:hypothetical protein